MLGNIYYALKIGEIISQNKTVKKLKTDWTNSKVEKNKLQIGKELHQKIAQHNENKARQDALNNDLTKQPNTKDIRNKPKSPSQSRSR